MRRFKFTLETVLRVKRSREEKVQLEFSAVLEKRALCLRGLASLEAGLAAMVESQSGLRGGTLEAAMIKIYEAGRTAQLEKLKWQRGALAEVEAELEAKRIELVAASRERKVLEKLEEGQFEAYLEKLNREEQAFLDELATHSSAAAEARTL
jgi:flagellar FliJ protein